MICLWHVRGKPEAFDQWITLDLEHIDTWPLWRDIRLVLDSAWYMASGRNLLSDRAAGSAGGSCR